MNPDHDVVEMSPFIARCIGEHGAFLHREQPEHVKLACVRVRERQLSEVSFSASAPVRLRAVKGIAA